MMPELGKYAETVLGAYAASFALLALLVGASLWQARRARRALDEVEKRERARHAD
ncbi:heme exporter protein CcmD [Poseidonocella sedimentorum]|uniref:Heme exporter protein D n=1 Tax=Poseidonocella sedimentorum TaxID=871652 RepID=A0A1I6DZH5_9RHOB|nr:heme exporter protein CcmD [Poseidonocella sedimentorum]SFR10920.1 heme exporter protein D [Poseidonocella sedimentorum]